MREPTQQTAPWLGRPKGKTRRSGSGDVFFVDSATPFSASTAGRMIDAILDEFGRCDVRSVYLAESEEEAMVRWHDDVEEAPIVIAVEPIRRLSATARVVQRGPGTLDPDIFMPSEELLDDG